MRPDRRRPEYLRMLGGILVTYGIIIGFGDTVVGGPGRVLLLGYLLWTADQIHGLRHYRLWTVALTAVALAVAVVSVVVAPPRVASSVVGACTLVLIVAVVVTIVTTLVRRARVDTPTVLGVLCVYLLLAMLFAALHQLLAITSTDYLSGVAVPPPSSDLLYFSVITLATVGFGDITPVSEIARAVTVLEALTGQMYLVSVVAAVVGGWRRPA